MQTKHILLSLIALYAASPVWAQTAEEQIQAALKAASKPQQLLHSNAIVVFGHNGEAVVITDNARWVVKGQLYDMWANVEVDSHTQLQAQEQTLPLDKISVNTEDVFDVELNSSLSQQITVFIDPFADNTPNTLSVLRRFVTDHSLRIILTPMESEHVMPFLAFYCANVNRDNTTLMQTIINRDFPAHNQSCEHTNAMNSIGLTSFLRINESPTLVAPNQQLSAGMPDKFMQWLTANSN